MMGNPSTSGPARPRLVRPARSTAPFVLDPAQQAVVDRVRVGSGERLLVLAGPGTGKTTTLVEAVAARVAAGPDPSRVLVLTFSRKAAQELRARLSARLDRTLSAPLAWTFHAYCWSVLAELGPAAGLDGPLRLLAGPEQDVAVRELVEGSLTDGTSGWPSELGPALRTRGFADELRALLAKARSLGMDPVDLAEVSDRADWRAAARFFEEYLDVLDARGAVDYAEVVLRAARLLESVGSTDLSDRYDLVVVDEYQDTDPAQEALLRALVPAHSSAGLVVVGDPDQSIYAFRGADVRNITDFPTRFPRADGNPADVLALDVCRRSGAALLAASRSVIDRSPLSTSAGIPREVARRHRALQPAVGLADGEVEAITFAHDAAEAHAVADLLRREHLENGTPWDRMAVVVRSAARSVPRLRRALLTAGVPVEVAADELPLAKEAAPQVLLTALECAVDLARVEPTGSLDADTARALLVSPLGGADAGSLRRLGRALRAEARAADEVGEVPPSAELIRECLVDPRVLVGVDPAVARPAQRVADLLAEASALVEKDAGAYEVLWSIWSATTWPRRLHDAAMRGGHEGRRADHELDAVLALFDLATAHDAQPERRGLANFAEVLTAQQIPGETLAEKGVRPGAVRLLTAHRSKGLEWDVVVVAGVEEDVWPDLRRRGSLLQADRLAADGAEPVTTSAAVLAEERRLFYVACTRARRRLVVTGVDSPAEDGPRASRFVADLGVEPAHVDRLPRRPLSLRGLVAELRRVAQDPQSSPELRAVAIDRLGALAAEQVDGRPLVPAAAPAAWWGLHELTRSERPLAPAEGPIRLSGSTIRDLGTCPAQWLLSHEARARGPRPTAMGFGSVVHALADAVVRGTLAPDIDELMGALDQVWSRLDFAAAWQRDVERDAAREALGRFLRWHQETTAAGRRAVATEERFTFTIEVGADDSHAVEIRGAIDRVDLDADGRVVVVDYKTGANHPAKAAVEVEPQLATYQRAVEAGALAHVLGDPPPELGGAELVQLRHKLVSPSAKVQSQSPLRDPGDPGGPRAEIAAGDAGAWFDDLVSTAAGRIAGEDLPAVPGSWCEHCEFTASCSAQPTGRGVVE